MTTTSQKIEKALSILSNHDWYWAMADYSSSAYDNAYGSMRSFVEVVASIADSTIVKALRDLWKATYEYVHTTMFGSDDAAKAEFKSKEAELMAVIKPTYTMAA
jgi:hypothetical protein